MRNTIQAATTCDCPRPPGGTVTCSEGQAAYCWVDEAGDLQSGCITLPPSAFHSFAQGKRKAFAVLLANAISNIVDIDAKAREQIIMAIDEGHESLELKILGHGRLALSLPLLGLKAR